MTTIYVTALVLVLSSVQGYDGMRRGALSYIVHKGCLYMSHYVRDNYPVLEPTHDTSVNGKTNWVDWARDRAGASYLPDELLHGLIECGRGYTFYALSAPQWLITEHGLTEEDSQCKVKVTNRVGGVRELEHNACGHCDYISLQFMQAVSEVSKLDEHLYSIKLPPEQKQNTVINLVTDLKRTIVTNVIN